jgi:hypothetical protein
VQQPKQLIRRQVHQAVALGAAPRLAAAQALQRAALAGTCVRERGVCALLLLLLLLLCG